MEYVLCALAALTAGVGTGLAGLSAATVMVPVMIVLCPSFAGETGAYHATAIALASDILGSAFTSAIYIRHRNVDLKRGGVMMACIVAMCIAGSVAAWHAGHVVLGTFSLFLCVGIGIRVNNRVVGLVTGAVLTVLGVVMLVLHYREALANSTLVWKVLVCFKGYLVYLAFCLAVLLSARALFPINAEVWRKALHFVAYTSSLCMMLVSHDWLTATLCCLIFAAVVYPVLRMAESWKGYDRLFTQRRPGEVRISLLLLFCSHAALIALCWGWLNRPYIAVAAILMWGVGDTAAALVGKKYGKHYVRLPLADGRKTWEGSIAMLLCALIVGFLALLFASPMGWPLCLLHAAAAAPVAAYVELISHGGNDTITVPVATAAVLTLLSLL